MIEIIVAMAIVSIMAGVIMPISYRIWESKEIEVTLQRMAAIKTAMVGDRQLHQGGIRTDYGFAGDNGELPELISDLITDRGIYGNWNGSYLVSGFDPAKYASDAWGEQLIYSTSFDASGRRVSAALTSKGPDRTLNTADDLNSAASPGEQVYQQEVTPTSQIRGNIAYAVSVSATDETPVYYASMTARYRDLGSFVAAQADHCIPVDVGLVQNLVPRSSSVSFNSNFPEKVPVGELLLKSNFYNNSSCTGPPVAESDEMAFFVSDGLAAIYVSPPAIYLHIVNGP